MKIRHLVAVAIAVVAATTLILLADAITNPGTEQAPPGPIIAFRPGDVLTYSEDGETVTYEALDPTTVLGGGLEPERALPLLEEHSDRPLRSGSILALMNIREGGLSVAGSYCALSPDVRCTQPAVVSWQHCPAMIVLGGPLSTLTQEDLANPPAVIQEPARGLRWVYDVQWEAGNRVRLVLTEESEHLRRCTAPDEAVIDVERQVFEFIREGGSRTHLISIEPGEGQLIGIGAEDLQTKRFVAPDSNRTGPHPPGAGQMGPQGLDPPEGLEER